MLIVTRALGAMSDFAIQGRSVEEVRIASDDLARRVLRLQSSLGEIGVRLEGSERLHHGDVLFADERRVVCVAVAPESVLAARPATLDTAMLLAHALGNRHLPAQIEGGEIVVRYDPLIEALLQESGVPYVREERLLARPFLHAHAPHAHASEG